MPVPDSLLYPDSFDTLDVEDESRQEPEDQEYSKFELNLGAETPGTSSNSTFPLDEGYLVSRLSGTKEAPSRGKLWRSSSFYDKLRRRDALVHEKEGGRLDKDCGICFEAAVSPARTLCCGKLFCTDHIMDVSFFPVSLDLGYPAIT
ncbi:hypothetical protein L218DRAFT_856679 [Marasmius fiardii PR-910]|nr:hypothetical protein L218DRAFT_856679 [Marasmius fiardii PR-910]